MDAPGVNAPNTNGAGCDTEEEEVPNAAGEKANDEGEGAGAGGFEDVGEGAVTTGEGVGDGLGDGNGNVVAEGEAGGFEGDKRRVEEAPPNTNGAVEELLVLLNAEAGAAGFASLPLKVNAGGGITVLLFCAC